MNIAVCTIFEHDYHLGVAALVNSLYKSGFRGDVFAAYKGSLPPWVRVADSQAFTVNDGLRIIFRQIQYPHHLTNFKPILMLDIFNENPDIDGLLYFDPDIVVTARFSFFQNWVQYGIALCSDQTRYMMHPTHPIKQNWRHLLGSLFTDWRDFQGYANAGFVGVHRAFASILLLWKDIIARTIVDGFGQKILSLGDPTNPFSAQDQDALNAAIHFSDVPMSLAGQEEMGFFASTPYMAHALGSHKPWRRRFIREALRGRKPSFAAWQYWNYVQEPIRLESPWELGIVRAQIFIVKAIASIRS